MKKSKRIISLLLAIMLIATCFAGCSSTGDEKYTDTTVIVGYTAEVAPFIENVDGDKAEGFIPELWGTIFDAVKGDTENYRFELVEEGYDLEEDGGFTDSKGKEYSASLLVGAVSKDNGTFNEDYSFTKPIISNRIIAVTGGTTSIVKTFNDLAGANVVVVTDIAEKTFKEHSTIYNGCASVTKVDDITSALTMINNGTADFVVTDEFTYNKLGDEKANTVVLEGEFDTIEYVIACAKYSGWKDSINEAIRELKSEEYGEGDEFTPIVEKYFGYDASPFVVETEEEEK